jgi:hypothetical protein
MNAGRQHAKLIQGILAVVAATFGLATVVAGGRVLIGSDPGYVVFRPLLFYNTVMGVAYLAAAVIMWRSLASGKFAAATIFVLNLFVLVGIGYLYANGHAVAIESIRAMTFRTGIWLCLFLGLAWLDCGTRAPVI